MDLEAYLSSLEGPNMNDSPFSRPTRSGRIPIPPSADQLASYTMFNFPEEDDPEDEDFVPSPMDPLAQSYASFTSGWGLDASQGYSTRSGRQSYPPRDVGYSSDNEPTAQQVLMDESWLTQGQTLKDLLALPPLDNVDFSNLSQIPSPVDGMYYNLPDIPVLQPAFSPVKSPPPNKRPRLGEIQPPSTSQRPLSPRAAAAKARSHLKPSSSLAPPSSPTGAPASKTKLDGLTKEEKLAHKRRVNAEAQKRRRARIKAEKTLAKGEAPQERGSSAAPSNHHRESSRAPSVAPSISNSLTSEQPATSHNSHADELEKEVEELKVENEFLKLENSRLTSRFQDSERRIRYLEMELATSRSKEHTVTPVPPSLPSLSSQSNSGGKENMQVISSEDLARLVSWAAGNAAAVGNLQNGKIPVFK